jgi:hypothetical protein
MVGWMAAIILAATFVWSALEKSRDRVSTHTAAAALLDRPVSRIIVPVLIGAELAVALLLVVPGTRTVGSVMALGLLILFSALISIRLRAGQSPSCFCFGSRSARTISWLDVVRNAALAVLAVVAALG